jgi:transposase-like protein
MKHAEFIQYLSVIDDLNSKQRKQLSAVLQDKSKNHAVIKTLEVRINNDGHCPHCKHHEFQKWGKAHEMQRYRCKSCLKTFNSVTGTPLARLRKKEKWLSYSESMIDGHSIRKAAKICEVDKTTSFRWRHRFLHTLKDKKDNNLNGIIEADETFF